MLVLTRKANEQIQIGDQVVITVLQVKGQSVRIGIEAPREVLVLRAELPKHVHSPNSTNGASDDSAGLSSTRTSTPHRTATKSTRRTHSRARPSTDARRHPDRTRSFAARPAFLNQL